MPMLTPTQAAFRSRGTPTTLRWNSHVPWGWGAMEGVGYLHLRHSTGDEHVFTL